MSTETIRIVLVDDQPLIRTGFTTILQSEPGFEVVGEASNGQEALDLIPMVDPDVVCMDVQMPVLDGIEATRQLNDTASRASVLVLTTFDRDDFLFQTLQAGASGFLLKTAEAEELIDAVRTLARGEALLAPEVTGRVLQRFVTSGSPASSDATRTVEKTEADSAAPVLSSDAGLPVHLTHREREILELVSQGRSNGEIAEQLFVGTATVKTHVSNLLMKLGVKDRIHAVIWAYEHGVVPGGR